MNYNSTGNRGDLAAFTITSGLAVNVVPDATSTGCLLLATTYYFPFGGIQNGVPVETVDIGLNMKWAAAVAGTATIEGCNFPATIGGSGQGGADITDWDSGANWVQIDPTLTGAIYCNAVGANNTVAKYTVTLGGTNAGACIWNIPDFGFRRGRVKLVLSVGGIVRCNISGKLGG